MDEMYRVKPSLSLGISILLIAPNPTNKSRKSSFVVLVSIFPMCLDCYASRINIKQRISFIPILATIVILINRSRSSFTMVTTMAARRVTVWTRMRTRGPMVSWRWLPHTPTRWASLSFAIHGDQNNSIWMAGKRESENSHRLFIYFSLLQIALDFTHQWYGFPPSDC